MPEGENDGARAPFEVVGETTVVVGRESAQEASELQREVEHLRLELRANIEERQAALVSLRQEREAFQNFRQRVRDKAIEVAAEQDWCRPGLNEVLRDLGLPEHNPTFRVPVEVVAKQTVYIEIGADNEEDALDELEAMSDRDLARQVDHDSWEIDSWEKAEYQSVEEVEVDW